MMMIAAMMLMCVGAFAQEKGLKCLGAGVAYGIKSDFNKFALDVKAQYNVTKYFRGEVDFKFYPKQDDVTVVNPNLNLQYLFPTGDSEKFFIYPTAGVGVLICSYGISGVDNESMVCLAALACNAMGLGSGLASPAASAASWLLKSCRSSILSNCALAPS